VPILRFVSSLEYPKDWVRLLRARAQGDGGRPAFRFLADDGEGARVWTYGELERRSLAIAAALQGRYAAGDRVLVTCPPGLDFIAALLGCMCAGVIAVPTQPPRGGRRDRAGQRAAGIVADCAPRAVLTTRAQATSAGNWAVSVGASIEVVCVDEIADESAESWKDPSVKGESVAFLQYTSGSTRAPRGVVLTHANLLDNSEAIRTNFGHTAESVGVLWLPPYHDMGLIGGILQPLYAGYHQVLMSPQSFLTRPARWLRAFSDYRGSTTGAPDFAYALCARAVTAGECEGLALDSWRLAASGAEMIRAETMDAFAAKFEPYGFRRSAFHPCYGLAEATLMVSGAERGKAGRIGAAAGRPAVSCGTSRGGIEVIVVDPHSRRPSADNTIGEVWLRGGSVARGYWGGGESAFDATLAGDPYRTYLRTGDLGFLAEGELFITGRLKELIVLRGVKHVPQDVERTAEASHPALRPGCSAAFSYERDGRERAAIACEVQRTSRQCDPQPIVDAVCSAVAEEHGIELSAVVLLPPGGLPQTPSGKAQRRLCCELFLRGELDALASWENQRQVERENTPTCSAACAPEQVGDRRDWLMKKVAERLGVVAGAIDPAQPLVRYGLSSAVAVGLAGEISEALGLDLPATLFWDYPSVAELAEYLDASTAGAAAVGARS